MERTLKLLDKTTLEILEYDLNVFYAEDWSEKKGTTWDECYTIQPSAYYVVRDSNVSNRIYFESFKLTLAETRAIAPDFPEDEWGSDFFMTLDYFIDTCKVLPDSVKSTLDKLPDLNTFDLDPDSMEEVKWIN
jgi:hypothetical protein